MIWRLVKLPFRLMLALSKRALLLLFLLAVVLAFSAVLVRPVFDALSGIVESVAPDYSLRAEQERLLAAARSRADGETKRANAAVAAAADLKDRNATLSQNNDALTATNTALKQQGDTLTQANAALEAENKALKAKAALAEVTYQGRTIPAAEAVSEAAKDLAGRISAAARRRLATAPGEAVPFYGLPLVAADARADLEADCAALRSLRGLDVAFNADSTLQDDGVCALTPPDAAALWQAIQSDAPSVWEKLTGLYDGLPVLLLPPWWDSVISQGATLLTPMPKVIVKP